jgi:hypothetical protein
MTPSNQDEARQILDVAKKIQRAYRLRKTIDTYVNDSLAYVPGHVRDALKEPRGALTVEMDDLLKSLDSNSAWGMVKSNIAYELGDLSPEKLLNVLRIVPALVAAMGLVFQDDALPKPKKPEAMMAESYFKAITACLSGNTYRMVDDIAKRLDEKEPLFSHSEQRLRQALALLVQQGKVVHKKLISGHDSWRKPRRKAR